MTRHDDSLLWEYAARELDADDARAVEEHLEACARCREQLATVEVAREALETSRGAIALLEWDRVDAAVGSMVERRLNAQARPPWLRKVAAGGGLAVIAALALVLVGRVEPESPPTAPPLVADGAPVPAPLARARVDRAVGLEKREARRSLVMRAGADLEAGSMVGTSRGGLAVLSLPDSSTVRLAEESQLTLERLDVDDVGLRLQQGRVAIRAAHVERQGFAVSAGGLRIQVVGTVFGVASSKALTEVAVSEGRVRVELPDGERELVAAGQRLIIDRLGRVRLSVLSADWKRELAHVGREGELDASPEPRAAVAPVAGGPRSPPPLVAASGAPRTLPRLDRDTARARVGRLPAEATAPEPSAPREVPVVEAPIVRRIEPHTELVVEPPPRDPAGGEEASEWAVPPASDGSLASQGGDEAEWASLPGRDAVAQSAVPSAAPAVFRRSGKLAEAPGGERAVVGDLETIFMHRAEAALAKGACERFLVGLEDIAQDSSRTPRSELARVLRARCYELELRPRQAINEYRKYLEEYPRGRYVDEAREALGAP